MGGLLVPTVAADSCSTAFLMDLGAEVSLFSPSSVLDPFLYLFCTCCFSIHKMHSTYLPTYFLLD